jgi:alcohol dehydrogenase class IV
MGGVHSLSHSLGALGHHHGTLNAIMLPHVLAYNAGCLTAKMPVMCEAMGLPAGVDLPAAFAALNRRLGLPAGLRALGIEEAVFPAIAAASLLDNAHKTNPRALTREDYMALLNAAR